eukprot:TRINITY_DN29072_c0_g1_i1.p2 TRINITY_DN29072_c0_g1~~TRINITY_DN29072_c0_g1_i1.p2  ORF type:complete len:111 (+),score=26.25 TRINITY_DN29072_c0_g1_i1:59-391(+)
MRSIHFFFFLMIRRPPRSTHCISSAASDVYKRQYIQKKKIQFKSRLEKPPRNNKNQQMKLNEEQLSIICILCEKLNAMSEKWAITGSFGQVLQGIKICLLYTSPSPRDQA